MIEAVVTPHIFAASSLEPVLMKPSAVGNRLQNSAAFAEQAFAASGCDLSNAWHCLSSFLVVWHSRYRLSIWGCIFSSDPAHCLIRASSASFIAVAEAAAPTAACFLMSSICASCFLRSATASQVPTLRPLMFMVKSPCLPPFVVMVLLNSVRAALYCWSITIVLPSLQDSVTVVRVAVRLLSVTL